ncbi:MAG: hypothetical protein QOF23_1123, partial [Solirubrobacterales bacterium]|nr:hypothetical protein [Solirubrobacterales bacterium]
MAQGDSECQGSHQLDAGIARHRRFRIAYQSADARRLLTMIVSLEAILLSTFVMISQNRADAK